jgi:hypothetical protein
MFHGTLFFPEAGCELAVSAKSLRIASQRWLSSGLATLIGDPSSPTLTRTPGPSSVPAWPSASPCWVPRGASSSRAPRCWALQLRRRASAQRTSSGAPSATTDSAGDPGAAPRLTSARDRSAAGAQFAHRRRLLSVVPTPAASSSARPSQSTASSCPSSCRPKSSDLTRSATWPLCSSTRNGPAMLSFGRGSAAASATSRAACALASAAAAAHWPTRRTATSS